MHGICDVHICCSLTQCHGIVQCIFYLRNHAPVCYWSRAGADVKGEGGVASGHQHLAAGDTVKVELDVEVLKLMQEQHGGWNDTMSSVSACANPRLGCIVLMCQPTAILTGHKVN